MSREIRSYSELCKLSTFAERYNYLRLNGDIGAETFGRDRWLNQLFYTNSEWRKVRNAILLRDNWCDLGIPGYEFGAKQKIIIHHMNPICLEDLENNIELCMNPEFLISTSLDTHNAIHYGKALISPTEFIVRQPNDTSPWLHEKGGRYV